MSYLIATLIALALGFQPCATEDSANCTWDATTHGNGQGTSFIDIAGVTYSAK